MPLVQVQMLEGFSREVKETLIKDTSDVIAKTLQCDLSKVRLIINEIPAENWGNAGHSLKSLEEHSNR